MTELFVTGVWLLSAVGCKGVVGEPSAGAGSPGGAGAVGTGPSPTDPGIIGVGPTPTDPVALSCTPGDPPPTTRLFRLSHTQYDNAVRALTGLDVHPSTDLPPDQDQAGFDRGMDLEVGDALGKAYRSSAETLAAAVVGSPTAFLQVVACDPGTGDACLRSFIARFGRLAYRRALSGDEQAAYQALAAKGPALVDGTADAFHKSVQTALEAFLQSPNFLYRPELSTTQQGSLVTLSGLEIASRLSFLIQNGPPDDTLLQAAEAGQLATSAQVADQARRLVATPAARDTVRDFHHQWLQMDAYANRLTKDPTLYPTVTPGLAPTLVAELERFVGAVTFDLGKGFPSLVTAPFTFVNQTTAPLYGLAGITGDALERVDLDPTQRAGLFTRLGFLAVNAYSNQSSPIHRGAFIQRSVLCATIPDPPPNVPQLPPLGATQTTRQEVDLHTAPAACAGCHHAIINPVGFGFEHYDAVGQWRSTENGFPIDATGTLAGTAAATAGMASFTDAISESRLIAASPEARRCYATQWVRYAFGRQETTSDSCPVAAIAASLGDDSYKVTDLMVDVTRTKPFMFRAPGGP